MIFQFIRWDQLGQLDPAVVTREFATKQQKEVLKRELVTMLTPVDVEKVAWLVGTFGSIRRHYTASHGSDPLQRN